ncbi:MAG TPA: hypothetical protein VJ831_16070 [Jatrophihabitantaceae bacterium]|nr:hypothetical protein [Jatrophihabitantaceae bacterium]
MPADRVRLVLSPAARVLWRGPSSVQLEIGDDAIIVDGARPETIRSLVESTARATDRCAGDGLPREAFAPEALRALGDAGFVRPRAAQGADPRATPPVPRLAADLLALSARFGPEAAAVLGARRSRNVAVEGTSRIATHLAALLGAAGVGRVYLPASGDVRLHQAMPGGLTPADEGRRFTESSGDAVRRAAPDTELTPLPMGQYPDLVVLASDAPVDPDRRDALHAARCAHLLVQFGLDSGTVGPLVVPGRTSCLACAELARRDRDPAWPALAVQLTVAPRRGTGSDVVLVSALAAVAAQQVLAYLDGEPVDAVADGSLELRCGDWRVRRRTRLPHPDCDCGAAFPDPD